MKLKHQIPIHKAFVYKTALLLMFSIIMNSGFCQGIQTTYLVGRVKKHSPNLLYNTPPLAQGFEISYLHYTDKKRVWQSYWGNPIIDLTGYFINFGDNDVLGSAIGFLPALHFWGLRKKEVSLRFSIGAGLAYLTKKYDWQDNFTNNAIGSHFNNGTRFGVHFDYKNLGIGGNLYHFSNGSTSTPNSGINTLMVNLSYRFIKAKKPPIIEYQRVRFDKKQTYKKWGFDLLAVHGFNQFVVPGGPTYNINSISIGAYKSLSPYIRLHSGLEYEYNETLYNFYINDFHTKQEANDLAYNAVWYVGCELFFGDLGFRPKIGYYLPYPIPESGDPFYIKLETHYYPIGRNRKISPYIGVALKSHFAVAQYVSIQGGVNI